MVAPIVIFSLIFVIVLLYHAIEYFDSKSYFDNTYKYEIFAFVSVCIMILFIIYTLVFAVKNAWLLYDKIM